MALNCGVRPPVSTEAGYSLLQNSSNNATNEPLVTAIFSPRSPYMLSGFCMMGSMHEYTDQGGGASTRVYQYNYGESSHRQKVGNDAEMMNGDQAPFYMRNNSNDLQQLQVDDQGAGMAEMVDEQGYNCVHPSEMKKRRLSNEQVKSLEVSFDMESKLEPDRKNQLAQELGLQPRQVAVWFQNRRARYKTKQLERDYDILKQQFDAVRSEKDKLQAEVARLKDLLDAQIACGKDALTPSNDQGQDENMESPHENQGDDLQNLSTSSGGAGKQKAKLSHTSEGGADAFSGDNSSQTQAHVKVEATRKSPKLDVKPSLVAADPHLLLRRQQQEQQQFRSNLNPLSTRPQQQVLLHHMTAVKMEENDHLHEPEHNLSYITEHHNIEDDEDSILYFNRWHHDP